MNASRKAETIVVEVAYATPARQVIVSVQVPCDATVERVIHLSGILQTFPEIDPTVNAVGIFGERVRLDDVVNRGDRVEIYRALLADPKQVRRRRATPRSRKPKRA